MRVRQDSTWRRLLRRHRRLLAGTAAAVSIATLGMALQPPAQPTRPVVVAAADLPAGRILTSNDLQVAHVASSVLPQGTYADPEDLSGEFLIAPLQRGEVVGEHRLVPPPAWALPMGTAPMPVRFADPGAVNLLRAGARIDVLAAPSAQFDGPGSAPAAPIAADLLVLAVLQPDGGDPGLLGSPAVDGQSSALVVVAADRASALAIAGSQGRANLTFLLQPSAERPPAPGSG